MYSGQWEYMILKIGDPADDPRVDVQLNQRGKDGWEAVSMVANVANGGYTILLKRKTA